ncbi:NAD-dependent dehydratase [Candidatus Kaiserbacteria bacterium CG10_big_fil_rev_8_21_14_0_10_49_17]|uniref:NAD-dependent dehydratase n=1 Tax=Candidatus Kaiserbacteria bacterium CG10_big_fil_rev_8_21_14_0_10_49_17 TaxID=1974609 RepID=A0A2M6WDY4_9BACT|nr:MAG: NAD-dependent dehydratase [Candidatus Kaiserbacteria bacterium CG10_big_fil_rev_8_21_14_0_10_49_17]
MYLSRGGYEVAVLDGFQKRRWEAQIGVQPLAPIHPLQERVRIWKRETGKNIRVFVGDLAHERFTARVFEQWKPDAIIHYGEQPSAPFSMMGNEKAVETQVNNVAGNLNVLFAMKRSVPTAHLIKLGTMGEYGTPNIDIEEGWLDIEHKGRKDRVLMPKKPGSFYHLSKVHDSHNCEFVCRVWNLRITDLNQGVVYGIETDETQIHEELNTSFHYDEVFGTALNRFCVQAAAGLPITPYGSGGQKRGFLNIRDTIQCVELALSNPPLSGEFRVFNQFTEVFSIRELASTVAAAAKEIGVTAKVEHIINPRIEEEEHYYNPVLTHLPSLGLKPHKLSDTLVKSMLSYIKRHSDRIDPDTIAPRVKWEGYV